MRQTTIQAYPYQQYKNDADITPFFDAYNAMAQEYVDWFAGLNLPIYTLPQCSGAMLDWVAEGIYGTPRPNLSTGNTQLSGQFNTAKFDTQQFNASASNKTGKVIATTDDVFKRILTWNSYRADGFVFNTRWLKRRVMRFLLGANGASPAILDTNQLSVIYNSSNNVTLRFYTSSLQQGKGQINTFQNNMLQFNQTLQTITGLPNITGVDILAACMASGSLDLPFQFNFTIVQS